MRKTILIFGLISGLISSLMMAATMTIFKGLNDHHGYLLGYTSIVLSFLLVYFGIRSYRDNIGGGQITFGRAFAVGICITLISCVFYVVTWEIIYFNFMPGYLDSYGAAAIEKLRAAGASAAAIQAKTEEMAKMAKLYRNPLYNAAMTFLEPFPVGLVITLISAAVLRKKAQPGAVESALTA
jgi:hypothetical protein